MKNDPSTLKFIPVIVLAIATATFVACAAENPGKGEAAGTSGSAGTEASGEVIATFGGQTITMRELDQHLVKTNAKAVQSYYDARRAALDQMIAERLLDAEAESRGMSRQQLQQEILGSVTAVTDADIENFYNQNKARLQNRALDDPLKGQIRNYLSSQGQQGALTEFIDGLRKKAGVNIALEPPRVEVRIAANDPYKGPEGAPVQIVEYMDFQ